MVGEGNGLKIRGKKMKLGRYFYLYPVLTIYIVLGLDAERGKGGGVLVDVGEGGYVFGFLHRALLISLRWQAIRSRVDYCNPR